ncbi:hypothetical protein NPIL_578401 [Nephila pilipes]|uniref:Uncharacterized protein n=1 Tax=Nephila pilipes TaxID=299642 RepID=A0A8X6P9X3_NEPPI|nr:hypothetical protein NPIL_578401 [Nephila pilipes]
MVFSQIKETGSRLPSYRRRPQIMSSLTPRIDPQPFPPPLLSFRSVVTLSAFSASKQRIKKVITPEKVKREKMGKNPIKEDRRMNEQHFFPCPAGQFLFLTCVPRSLLEAMRRLAPNTKTTLPRIWPDTYSPSY